jgi:hypothetical protein
LTADDAVQLSCALQAKADALKGQHTVHVINLTGSHIGDAGLKALADVVVADVCRRVVELRLDGACARSALHRCLTAMADVTALLRVGCAGQATTSGTPRRF